MRLINGRGFNTEEVIIFTEKMHTQKIPFLNGIFSEKYHQHQADHGLSGRGMNFAYFNDRSNFKVSHIIAIGRRAKKNFCQKK